MEAEGGSGCYPFADALESKLKDTSYPESKLPQCKYSENEDGICAFVFEDANDGFSEPTECEGRRYSMQTFDTRDDVPPRASITHKGPCGVCSSAQDLSRSMKLRNRLATIGTLCGTSYYLSGLSFETLVQCFEETAGVTRDCAELWGLRSRLVVFVPNFILSFMILVLVKRLHPSCPPPPSLLRAVQTNGEPRLLSW